MNLLVRAAARFGARPTGDGELLERAMRASRPGAAKRDVASAPGDAQPAGVQRPRVVRLRTDDPVPGGVAPTRAAPRPDVPRGAPAPLLIDVESLRERGFVTGDDSHTPAAQSFRVIKRPLIANAFGRGANAPVANGRRVMVTSALPDEGKSYCAINLAMSIAAERDHQVLLIDADVARPSLHRELGIEPGAGLMDWLLDAERDAADLVAPTNIDKLSILPAGRHHVHSTELIASDAMTRVLDRLTARYPDHLLVFDSPPLLNTTESRVLASYMGQIVMVVEAGETPRDAVDDALETLPDDAIVGLVLNKSRDERGGNYHYGYR